MEKVIETQIKSVLKAFSKEPKTMLMVEEEIGVRRTNFTSTLHRMKREETIYLVKFGTCPISQHKNVGFYSTNKDYAPIISFPNQLNLF